MKSVIKAIAALYAISLLISMAGMEVFSWLTAFLGLFYFKAKPHKVIFGSTYLKLIVWPLMFFCVVALGALFSPLPVPILSVIGEVRWVLLLVLLSLAFQFVPKSSQQNFFKYLLIIGTVVGLYGFFQYFWGYDLFRDPESYRIHASIDRDTGKLMWRTRGFFSHPLTYANSMGIFLCFPLAFLFNIENFKNRKITWMWALICSFTLFASILTTFSRGGWLAVGFAVVLMIFLSFPVRRALAIGAVFLAIGAVAISQSGILIRRFISIFNFSHGEQSDRFYLWHANWEMFKDHPLLGVGYNMNKSMVEPYMIQLGYPTEFVSHAHNTFFQILGGTGLLGVVSLYSFFILIFVTMIRKYRQSKETWEKSLLLGAIAAQVCLHIGGITEANFEDGEVRHMIVFVWAWFLVYINKTKT